MLYCEACDSQTQITPKTTCCVYDQQRVVHVSVLLTHTNVVWRII